MSKDLMTNGELAQLGRFNIDMWSTGQLAIWPSVFLFFRSRKLEARVSSCEARVHISVISTQCLPSRGGGDPVTFVGQLFQLFQLDQLCEGFFVLFCFVFPLFGSLALSRM